jgi:hypothetical protein
MEMAKARGAPATIMAVARATAVRVTVAAMALICSKLALRESVISSDKLNNLVCHKPGYAQAKCGKKFVLSSLFLQYMFR